jgi:hypothetical protein
MPAGVSVPVGIDAGVPDIEGLDGGVPDTDDVVVLVNAGDLVFVPVAFAVTVLVDTAVTALLPGTAGVLVEAAVAAMDADRAAELDGVLAGLCDVDAMAVAVDVPVGATIGNVAVTM